MTQRSMAAMAALAVWFSPALAGDRVAQSAVDMAMSALERGHGQMCSLTNQPVPSGGYWPCVDMGPYRFVREYGKVLGFVVIKDQAPFQILTSQDGDAEFTVGGPWQRDMAPRVGAWWDEEVMGGRQRRESAQGEDGRRDAANAVIQGLDGSSQPTQAQDAQGGVTEAQPPAAAPVQQPSVQTSESPQAAVPPFTGGALRDRPIPTRGPGVEIAPGVVRYPPGR